MGVGTAAKSNTDVNLASRGAGLTLAGWEVNDGENKVFPIQVSRQELLLFLGAVIFIATYKNIFYMRAQTVKSVNNIRFQAQCSPDANRRVLTHKYWKLRGSKLPHPGP